MCANRGYVGWSRSVRAAQAERDGKLPLSRAVDAVAEHANVTKKKAREILKELGSCEWHHTSKFFNRTEYYDVNAAVRRAVNDEHVVAMRAMDYETIFEKWPCDDENSLASRDRAIQEAAEFIAEKIGCCPELVIDALFGTW